MLSTRRSWPIIVGGCHRSGTSLVRRVLNAHSRIYCGPEVKFFRDFHGDYFTEDPVRHSRLFASARSMLPEPEVLEAFGKAFVELHVRAAGRAGKPRWADKCPENAIYLQEWQRLLGNDWVFLQVVRNPLDTLASLAETPFRYTLPADLAGRIEHYLRYAEAGLSFSTAHPGRSYRIVYERFVSSPRQELARLMHWLSEKLEPRQFDFNSAYHQPGLEDPKVSTAGSIHYKSLDRWKPHFAPHDVQLILERTAPMWQKLDTDRHYPLQHLV